MLLTLAPAYYIRIYTSSHSGHTRRRHASSVAKIRHTSEFYRTNMLGGGSFGGMEKEGGTFARGRHGTTI